MHVKVNSVMYPGELLDQAFVVGKELKLGPGLQLQDESNRVAATVVGELRYKQEPHAEIYWLEPKSSTRTYRPAKNDLVVGTILKFRRDMYLVDIGAKEPARLPALSFRQASKNNRPVLKIGDVVYAKVESALDNYPPILTCTWTFHDSKTLGLLTDTSSADNQSQKCDFLVTLKQRTVHNILNGSLMYKIEQIGFRLQFEIAIGINGKVWVNSRTVADTLQIVNLLLSLDE